MFVPEVGIDTERGGDVGVAHQLLGGFFVYPRFVKQRGVGVPELMQRAADPSFFLKFCPSVSPDTIRDGAFAIYRENVIVGRAVRDPVKEQLR